MKIEVSNFTIGFEITLLDVHEDGLVRPEELEKAIKEGAGKYLESVKLFDVYQGKQILPGKKSVAFSLTLRSAEGTLTDEQATSAVNKAIKSLEKVGAFLRS